MYDLLKGMTVFISPSGMLILAVLASAAWAIFRRSRFAIGAFVVSASSLAVVSCLPVGFVALYALEHRFPEWKPAGRDVAGIVMLDGRLDRLPYDLALSHAYPKARVIFSGRPEREFSSFPLLIQAGLSPSSAVAEPRSRDTYENALFSYRLARPKPGETWLLITSASHMPRAIATFRKVGFPVTAAPVAFKTNAGPRPFGARASEALTMLDEAFREAWGLIAYRMTGRTRELWPKP